MGLTFSISPMREIISRAMSSGLDFTQRGVLKSFLVRINIDEERFDEVYTAIKNSALEKEFKKVPYQDRFIFLPQCLRDSSDCEAELTDRGYECARCGRCSIDEIIEYAVDLGYQKDRIYISPGSSLVKKVVKNENPRAVIGVACYSEVVEGMKLSHVYNIPIQGVSLLKDGCKDTIVDMEKLKEVLKKKE